MKIRYATINDIPQLRTLYVELEKDGVLYQPEHFVVGQREDTFFEHIFESNYQDLLVAEIDSQIVAFCHVMILRSQNVSCLKDQINLYIQDLVVTENKRNSGIGTFLIQASKEYGKQHGAEFMRTQVFPQNTDGLRFYERNGFCETMKTIECPL